MVYLPRDDSGFASSEFGSNGSGQLARDASPITSGELHGKLHAIWQNSDLCGETTSI
jgi:hypothetical protein